MKSSELKQLIKEEIVSILNENSDSGWIYKIRKTCERK